MDTDEFMIPAQPEDLWSEDYAGELRAGAAADGEGDVDEAAEREITRLAMPTRDIGLCTALGLRNGAL